MLNPCFKKTIRAAVAVACAATLAIGASACGASNSGNGSDKVALLISTLNNPFFVDLRTVLKLRRIS